MARKRTFTVDREPVEAEIGGDLFVAPPVIPPAVLGDMLDAGERIGEIQRTQGLSQKEQLNQMMKVLDEVFNLVLIPDSGKAFHERLYSRENPFDLMREVMPALEWLIEEFTERPTEPSPPSSTGRSDGGTSSTPGVLVGASTPSPSTPDVSATPSTPPSST
ncbi:hypothetical protein K1W54_04590 [Micromonospora sp. CPCC 205371]|nr:hypothetical protein [Micromonospora sp. CPCC 205371]